MQEPGAPVNCIEGNRDGSVRGHDNGVADWAWEAAAANRDDLEVMSMQVHWMHHRGGIHKRDLDPVALASLEWLVLAVDAPVDCPAIARLLAEHCNER